MKTYITTDVSGLLVSYYHDAVHGPRRLSIPDPDYVRRQIPDPNHVPRKVEVLLVDGSTALIDDPSDVAPLIDDPTDHPPLIDGGPNLDTRIPPTAVEITDAQYRELLDNQGLRKVVLAADGAVSIEAYTPPPPSPEEVRSRIAPISAWQARKALTAAGLRQQIEDAIAIAPLDVRDAWEYATEFRRNDPVLVGMAAQLGLTDEQLDDLFRVGATL